MIYQKLDNVIFNLMLREGNRTAIGRELLYIKLINRFLFVFRKVEVLEGSLRSKNI